jgi:hypothetical protein
MIDLRSPRAVLRTVALLAALASLGVLTAIASAAGSSGGAAAGGGTDTTSTTTTPTGTTPAPGPMPRTGFHAPGMWIWQLGRSSGGKPQAIASKARHYHLKTVFIKSSDGRNAWKQFTSGLVRSLHAGGLRVCAWQYVYGRYPSTEAALGARAKRIGADCLVIDAEMEYEGRYGSAQSYMSALRKAVGGGYPVGLAGFPYVDYHPAFPYSVFFGPGGAQYNLPQMYWKAIGTTVDRVYGHTYRFNRPYARPIAPLGQLYMRPRQAEIVRFRQLARAFHAPGLSWWDWQEASASSWHAVGQSIKSIRGYHASGAYATLARGGGGDLVVWAQQHLRSAGLNVKVDGFFGSGMQHVVRVFQSQHALTVNGKVDTPTWRALLRYSAARVRWSGNGRRAHTTSARSSTAGAPRSASLPAVRREIPPKRH